MTNEALLTRLKTIYGNDVNEEFTDTQLLEYLGIANEEIIRWEYDLVGLPADAVDTSKYDNVKVFAVIAGLTQHGAEGVSAQSEGSFRREFSQADMLDYIHKNVPPFVGVGR